MSRLATKEALMRWVDDTADALDFDPRAALLLTKLASFADASMEVWAAIATLMRQARSSERKVQYLLRDFEARGLIRRTGAMHRLAGTTRDVPVYVFAAFLEDFAAEGMGARGAPIDAAEPPDGCTGDGGMGAQGVHPHNEPIEQTTSSEVDARARREALFEKLEGAVPKACLGATDRDRARNHFSALLDEGFSGDELVSAAARWTADAKAKRKDIGLHYWLYDRRFRQWLAEAPSAAAGEAAPRPAFEPPAEVRAAILAVKDSAWMATWLGQAVWSDGQAGGVIRCRLGIQADTVRAALREVLAAHKITVTQGNA
jgi:hypothetical protein